jgi:predicted nucleic-acid-binding Zn-ribbon protein
LAVEKADGLYTRDVFSGRAPYKNTNGCIEHGDGCVISKPGEYSMMTSCPECGSSEIVTDLIVFAGVAPSGQQLVYVSLQEPPPAKQPFIWSPKEVVTGFRAAICGGCGYTRFYTKQYKEILDAHQKGYTSQRRSQAVIIPEP